MNAKRNGNFTSSEIVALMSNGRAKDSFGVPFYTYVDEKNMERRLGRSIKSDVIARPLSWGKLCEERVFEILGPEYRLCSSETVDHPDIAFAYWKGSPDAEKFVGETPDAVIDIKCPQTLKSFCTMVDAFENGGILQLRDNHKDGDKYYWQLVSNAILLGVDWAELIVYCPYQDELEAIRELANQKDGPDISQYYWIAMGMDGDFPYLKREGYYKNLYKFRFVIPKADKELLTARVVAAGKMLVDFHTPNTK
jgi:hypothetical protein